MAGALLGLMLGGCVVVGADDPPGPTGPVYTYPTEAAFCAALATAECNDLVVEACYASDEASLPTDRSRCSSARENACNPMNLTYHPQYADDCIAERTRVLADAELTMEEIATAEEACIGVFSRGGAAGTPCTATIDCDTGTGLRCIMKPGTTSGSCEIPILLSGGDRCDAADAVCPADTFCSEMAGNYCVARPIEGEACSTLMPCADAYLCGATDMLCAAKAANGEVCAAAEECSSGFCTLPTGGGTSGICTGVWALEVTSANCDEFRD
jgi:hypothetical protein